MTQFTQVEVDAMHAAFTKVQNEKNWKLPIDKALALTDDEKSVMYEAIIFYTGSVPDFVKLKDGRYRVQAVGYYAAVGA